MPYIETIKTMAAGVSGLVVFLCCLLCTIGLVGLLAGGLLYGILWLLEFTKTFQGF